MMNHIMEKVYENLYANNSAQGGGGNSLGEELDHGK